MAEQTKTCANCGRTFTATRSDAKYCSTACRVGHWRKTSTRAYLLAPPNPYVPEGRPATEREIVGCIQGIRQSAATLDAASLTGPPRYRAACGRISRGVLDVLEVEGL